MAWRCPECSRSFGRHNQTHVCAPATTLEDWFDGRPTGHRAIADAVIAACLDCGPVVVEVVAVGVLLKNRRTFAELRDRKDGLALSLIHSSAIDDPRIYRRLAPSKTRFAHFIQLVDADDVDDQILGWIAQSYEDTA